MLLPETAAKCSPGDIAYARAACVIITGGYGSFRSGRHREPNIPQGSEKGISRISKEFHEAAEPVIGLRAGWGVRQSLSRAPQLGQ